ncbi:N-acetyltransferase [Vibrio coralliilyticus]|uniref:GNAT family N-acetyltransferase n=1 Tax=Vibrio coralliilyticus TaxID=190893 RepID=UPI000BAB1D3E|nr:GNAT family N-acetyltransferase [Vibrio coralliilyticus]NUW69855.1 GNAT family N-acetyltransferase [Vibrio coralliilyticus]PAU36174.1 N-acetyltransferase [Vibrio coralliilyticus]
MELKVAEYSDYERIASLHTQSWKKFYQGLLAADYLKNDVQDERLAIWQTRLINPPFNQHVLLLEEGGLLCGFICAFGNHDFEKGTIIDALHIDENYRGRGLGVKLIAEMAKWIAQHFPDNGVYLEVIKDNQQAVKFYDHIGGQLVQERMWKAPCGSQVPELVYAWKSGAELLERISIHTQTELVTD